MVDFRNQIISIKAIWVKRLISTTENGFVNKWRHLALNLCGIENTDILYHKLNPKSISVPSWCNDFYKQVLVSWYHFYSVNPKSYIEILNEKLLHNKFILSDGKTLGNNYDFLRNKNIKTIGDIVVNDNFISRLELELQIGCQIPILKFNTLLSAIPRQWKSIIRENTKPSNLSHFDVIQIRKNIFDVKCSDIYKNITFSESTPTAINKWIEYYPFLESFDWTVIFSLPNKICHEPRLQSFQYKILNRFFSSNYNLFLWLLKDSPQCDYCPHCDNIEHYFFYCEYVKPLWLKVQELVFNSFQLKFDFSVLEILLGIPCAKNTVMSCVNFIILYAKWYICVCKQNQRNILFSHFCACLKQRIDTEIVIVKCYRVQSNNEASLDNFNLLYTNC